MGMPIAHYYDTAADVLAMPDDGNRYDVVRGELLGSPGPRMLHQVVAFRLVQLIGNYPDRYRVGVGVPGGNLSWSDDTLVIPDLPVTDLEESRTMSWDQLKTVLLVVEILSPSTARHDRFTKRRLYQEVGIPLYWLVDADAQSVEVWTPDVLFPATEQETIVWHPAGAVEPLAIRLAERFREV